MLSPISMKPSPNWLSKSEKSAGEYFNYLVLKQFDFGENTIGDPLVYNVIFLGALFIN